MKQRLMLHQRQGYRCALCRIPFVPGEPIETDHIIPTRQGGTDDLDNKRLVHPWCHRQRHQKGLILDSRVVEFEDVVY